MLAQAVGLIDLFDDCVNSLVHFAAMQASSMQPALVSMDPSAYHAVVCESLLPGLLLCL